MLYSGRTFKCRKFSTYYHLSASKIELTFMSVNLSVTYFPFQLPLFGHFYSTVDCLFASKLACKKANKGKGMVLDIAPLTGAQYISLYNFGSGSWLALATVLRRKLYIYSGAHCPRNGLWTCSYATRRTTPQSATLGLHPVIHVPNYTDYYSFTDPWGMDGWVGHVGGPLADGLTTKWSPVAG